MVVYPGEDYEWYGKILNLCRLKAFYIKPNKVHSFTF